MSSLLKPLLLQSLRTGGLYLLIIALSLAISATTALKFSNNQVKQAVNLQAAQMRRPIWCFPIKTLYQTSGHSVRYKMDSNNRVSRCLVQWHAPSKTL